MYSTKAIIALPLVAALLAGPTALVLSQSSERDPGDLYLAIGSNRSMTALLNQPDIREIGPYRAWFGRVIAANPKVHESLVSDAYWIFPFSAFAKLCGIETTV